MGKKSKHKQPRTAQKAHRRTKASKRRWTFGHLITAFFLGVVLGFVIGYESDDPGARTDAFGRSPADPHYLHRHP